MAQYGNTSASSLLKTAQSAYNKNQEYQDSIASFTYYMSDASPEAFKAYSDYLKGRIDKVTKADPSKALSLTRTAEEAYRRFTSSEISRATLSVNYGESTNRDKYSKLSSLYQQAVANGDDALAARLESNLASLSVTIQNEDSAAAGRASAGAAKAAAALKTQIADAQNKLDRAYKTGDKVIGSDGVARVMNATDYALNQASIIARKYQLLSEQAASDPSKADDLSKLQESPEYRGLIDSGLVQFDANGVALATDGLKNLAVAFKKDIYGNTYRDFVSPDLAPGGKQQYGLVKTDDGSGNKKQYFVEDSQLDNTTTDPALKARQAFLPTQYKDANGKEVQGVGFYDKIVNGNRLLVQTQGTPDQIGLRAVAGKNGYSIPGQYNPAQDLQALKALTNPKAPFKSNVLTDTGDAITSGIDAIMPGLSSNVAKAEDITGRGVAAAGGYIARSPLSPLRAAFEGTKGLGQLISSTLGKQNQIKVAKAKAEAEAAAQAAQKRQLDAEYARQQAAATSAASRAATPAPRIVPVGQPGKVYLPTPKASPAEVFNAAKAAGKSTAAAIGNAVGYNF